MAASRGPGRGVIDDASEAKRLCLAGTTSTSLEYVPVINARRASLCPDLEARIVASTARFQYQDGGDETRTANDIMSLDPSHKPLHQLQYLSITHAQYQCES